MAIDLDLDSVIRRAQGIVEADVASMRVLLNDQLSYLGLDGVGTRIWELLETPRSFRELVASLTAEFDVDEATCRAEVAPFLTSMQERRLVEIR